MTSGWKQLLNRVAKRVGSRGNLAAEATTSSSHAARSDTSRHEVISRQGSDLSVCFDMDLSDTSNHGRQLPGLDPQLGLLLQALPGGAGLAPPAGGPTEQDDISSSSVSHRRRQAAQRRQESGCSNPMAVLYQLSSLMSLSTFFEYKLSSDTQRAIAQVSAPAPLASTLSSAAPSAAAANPAVDTALLGLVLSSWGYRVTLRRVTSPGTYWTKSMTNTFLVVLDVSSGSPVEYVLDPNFKEAFRTGVMSPAYRAIWSSLPPVFLGMPCQLQPVVALLCEEVELSFLEAGRAPPPWRTPAATLGRWMSHAVVDTPVPPAGAAQQQVAAYLQACRAAPPGSNAAAATSSSSSVAGPAAGSACAAAPDSAAGGGSSSRHNSVPLQAQHGFTPSTASCRGGVGGLPSSSSTPPPPPPLAVAGSPGAQQLSGTAPAAALPQRRQPTAADVMVAMWSAQRAPDTEGFDSAGSLGSGCAGIVYTPGSLRDEDEDERGDGNSSRSSHSSPSSVCSDSLAAAISPLLEHLERVVPNPAAGGSTHSSCSTQPRPPCGRHPEPLLGDHAAGALDCPASDSHVLSRDRKDSSSNAFLDMLRGAASAPPAMPVGCGTAPCKAPAAVSVSAANRPRSLLTEGLARHTAARNAASAAASAWGYGMTLHGGLDGAVLAGHTAAASQAQELLRTRAHLQQLQANLLQQQAAQAAAYQASQQQPQQQPQQLQQQQGGVAGVPLAAGLQRTLPGLPQQPAIRVLRLLPQSAVGMRA